MRVEQVATCRGIRIRDLSSQIKSGAWLFLILKTFASRLLLRRCVPHTYVLKGLVAVSREYRGCGVTVC